MYTNKNSNYSGGKQDKNLAWFLPRPKPDCYKGGMPLHAEEWCMDLACDLLGQNEIKILQLFCGMNKYGTRVDVNPEVQPDYLASADNLPMELKQQEYDVVFADPPYSEEEARTLYGLPKPPPYSKWTAEADACLRPGGLLVVYHKFVMPNPAPGRFVVSRRVFIGSRAWHVPRAAIFFRKLTPGDGVPDTPSV